eukprot:CAMPEP_0202899352 /NCGR_PEP_ID=MMETSP1392-20130828/7616_1 /ASSEMBLY_ACC=CAM_ASM_000868 /TAXON_ID=225041 /ORGANISM="Chlamydomonas chlamydogama, Strain SAG 11-48b" /LENGTH=470 /DNA_ID=CAMNT_0049585515 /DNA_START=249 /DNA_END=1661 /DNA_ORIENTATION=+
MPSDRSASSATSSVAPQSSSQLPSNRATWTSSSASSSPDTVLPPHSGYHFDGSPRRFFEGWYWRVQIPNTRQSFALIYSIEDPHAKTSTPEFPHAGVGVQVMGPDDGYICQFNRNTTRFWADAHDLALGAAFKAGPGRGPSPLYSGEHRSDVRPLGRMVSEEDFSRLVELGFQASHTHQQGSIVSDETGASGAPYSTVPSCSWNVRIRPVSGWGPTGGSATGQKATAGWLSVLSVFEPHWQILMSHGLASGWIEWGGKRYEFKDAPTYAEKNWGGGFPSKWHWVQCNSFEGHPGTSLTAVGARRALVVGVQGVEEDVGLIGIHHQGEFIELVPWTGDVEWDVDPWGRWWMRARNDRYEAVVEASCAPNAGMVLRAPTIAQGLAPFCKDTFFGTCRLRVWRRTAGSSTSSTTPFIDVSSNTAALEVGGGPWWSSWAARAAMKEPFRSLVQLPIDVGAIRGAMPSFLRPPGL